MNDKIYKVLIDEALDSWMESMRECEMTMDEILDKGLSVRQVEERMRALQQEAVRAAARPVKAELPSAHRDACERLSSQLKTKVEVSRNLKGRGSLTIRFRSDEEFERIMSLLQEKG